MTPREQVLGKLTRVPASNFLYAGTVPAFNFLDAGTVPAYKTLDAGTLANFGNFKNIIFDPTTQLPLLVRPPNSRIFISILNGHSEQAFQSGL